MAGWVGGWVQAAVFLFCHRNLGQELVTTKTQMNRNFAGGVRGARCVAPGALAGSRPGAAWVRARRRAEALRAAAPACAPLGSLATNLAPTLVSPAPPLPARPAADAQPGPVGRLPGQGGWGGWVGGWVGRCAGMFAPRLPVPPPPPSLPGRSLTANSPRPPPPPPPPTHTHPPVRWTLTNSWP